MAAIVLFLASYAAALWFKFDDRQDTLTTVVQGGAGTEASALPDSVMIASETEAPQEATSGGAAAGPVAREFERRESAATARRLTETASKGYEQAGKWESPPAEAATPQTTEPRGDLAISGRVVDRAGTPVPGIRVVARASYLFDRDKGKLIPVYKYQRVVTSGYDGAYALERLADGEYHISTEATEQYSRAQISVRAGADVADLVLTGHQDLRVSGLVTTTAGEPLAGVVVSPATQNAPTVSSNNEGHYGFEVKLLDNSQHLAVRASKQGFEDRVAKLDTSGPETGNHLELNIVMEADDDNALAEVTGRVEDSRNAPVVGQRIGLSSAKARQNYRTATDAEGRFVIRDVEAADDYLLSINAAAAYKDYFRKNIQVTRNDLTLNIELEALDTGTLNGQMLNVFGSPIPNFMLVLQTGETSYYNERVLGDAEGNFTIENVPAGALRLKTKSAPYYTVEGIQLEAGGTLDVPVVLDWGYDELRGQVLNDQGYPVAVTNIGLSWAHEQNGVRSTSRRTTSADEQGNFRFTRLGPGRHRLTVNATGYKPLSVVHDVALQGSDLMVKLQTP